MNMDVSKNRGGPPKSSILNWVFHEINHPFWVFSPIFGLTPIYIYIYIYIYRHNSWDYPFWGGSNNANQW